MSLFADLDAGAQATFVLGTLLGFLACRLMRSLQASIFTAPVPRYAA